MFIFTFSVGNEGRGRGSRSLIQIKNMYILSIDRSVKVKYLIPYIIRASSGHCSFARKNLILFLI